MCYTVAFEGWTRHLAVALEGIARDDKDLPEGAQQPVIDDLEETCHGEGLPGFQRRFGDYGYGYGFLGCVPCYPVVAV